MSSVDIETNSIQLQVTVQISTHLGFFSTTFPTPTIPNPYHTPTTIPPHPPTISPAIIQPKLSNFLSQHTTMTKKFATTILLLTLLLPIFLVICISTTTTAASTPLQRHVLAMKATAAPDRDPTPTPTPTTPSIAILIAQSHPAIITVETNDAVEINDEALEGRREDEEEEAAAAAEPEEPKNPLIFAIVIGGIFLILIIVLAALLLTELHAWCCGLLARRRESKKEQTESDKFEQQLATTVHWQKLPPGERSDVLV